MASALLLYTQKKSQLTGGLLLYPPDRALPLAHDSGQGSHLLSSGLPEQLLILPLLTGTLARLLVHPFHGHDSLLH